MLGAGLALGGCASDSSPMKGYSLHMEVTHPARSLLVSYDVTTSGLFTYRAGRDMLAGDAGRDTGTWQGRCSEAELAPVVRLLEENPDFEAAESQPDKATFRLQVARGGFSLARTRTSQGPTPFLSALWKELDELMKRKRAGEFDKR